MTLRWYPIHAKPTGELVEHLWVTDRCSGIYCLRRVSREAFLIFLRDNT